MIEFKGFPARMQFTPIPNILFSSLLPQIKDINELKVLLYIFQVLYTRKGALRYVSLEDLSSQAGLMSCFNEPPQVALNTALEALAAKGAIVCVQLRGQQNKAESVRYLYFLNSEANKIIITRILNGEIEIPGFKPVLPVEAFSSSPSDIFTLYEQNIGMLTPLIADELREAGKQYPESWIREAIGEAVALNKRNWRYIARILEHWLTEGKDDGTHRRNTKADTDPDKYIRGKYGHMVQR
jgi:DNA replication protein